MRRIRAFGRRLGAALVVGVYAALQLAQVLDVRALALAVEHA